MPINRQVQPEGASYSVATSPTGPGRTVYVSGVLASGDTLAEQTQGCFDAIERALAPYGGTLKDVARITGYLTSLDEYADFARLRGERFVGDLPASTVVQVAGLLAGAAIEIDAVAFLDD